MKQGKINAELKAKIDSLQKAIDFYTNWLCMEHFDSDQGALKRRITVLVEQKAELVKGI